MINGRVQVKLASCISAPTLALPRADRLTWYNSKWKRHLGRRPFRISRAAVIAWNVKCTRRKINCQFALRLRRELATLLSDKWRPLYCGEIKSLRFIIWHKSEVRYHYVFRSLPQFLMSFLLRRWFSSSKHTATEQAKLLI